MVWLGIVLVVSVDLFATVQSPTTFAVVVSSARSMMCELLGLRAVPTIEVFADPRYDRGREVHSGRLLSEANLGAEMIGGRMSAGYFKFRLDLTGDAAWFFVTEDEGMVDAVFTPMRTCTGVVLATALSLAAARHECGEFLDLEIRMLEPGESDPEAMLARTRLTAPGTGFAAQCERYMRQFTPLNDWPAQVSIASAQPTSAGCRAHRADAAGRWAGSEGPTRRAKDYESSALPIAVMALTCGRTVRSDVARMISAGIKHSHSPRRFHVLVRAVSPRAATAAVARSYSDRLSLA